MTLRKSQCTRHGKRFFFYVQKKCFAVWFSRCSEMLEKAVVNKKLKSERMFCILRSQTRSALFRGVRHEKLSHFVVKDSKIFVCHESSYTCIGVAQAQGCFVHLLNQRAFQKRQR